LQWYIRLTEENHGLNKIILKEFQFVDSIFHMWCSYLGELHNKLLYPPNLHLGKLYDLVKEISFEARLNLCPQKGLLIQLEDKIMHYVIIVEKEILKANSKIIYRHV
jgi:hypothetical protein